MPVPRPCTATWLICRGATRVQYAFGVLRFEPGSSLADWFARRDEPWGELVTMGPAGFESYARVRCLGEDRISGRVLFARLRVHLAGRTKTPGDCFHGLWAGAVCGMHGDPARGISPWFPASVLTGPKFRIPNREYMLFRGHLDEVGHWGATDPATGSSKDEELPPRTFCGQRTTGGPSRRTWTPASPGRAGPRGSPARSSQIRSPAPSAFTATERARPNRGTGLTEHRRFPVNRSACLHCPRLLSGHLNGRRPGLHTKGPQLSGTLAPKIVRCFRLTDAERIPRRTCRTSGRI